MVLPPGGFKPRVCQFRHPGGWAPTALARWRRPAPGRHGVVVPATTMPRRRRPPVGRARTGSETPEVVELERGRAFAPRGNEIDARHEPPLAVAGGIDDALRHDPAVRFLDEREVGRTARRRSRCPSRRTPPSRRPSPPPGAPHSSRCGRPVSPRIGSPAARPSRTTPCAPPCATPRAATPGRRRGFGRQVIVDGGAAEERPLVEQRGVGRPDQLAEPLDDVLQRRRVDVVGQRAVEGAPRVGEVAQHQALAALEPVAPHEGGERVARLEHLPHDGLRRRVGRRSTDGDVRYVVNQASSSSASGRGQLIDSNSSMRSSYGTPSALSRATSAPRAAFCWANSTWRGSSRTDSTTLTTSRT